jgi:hypothetical protein
MVSRDRVGLDRREIRGSPWGGAVLCACESGAVRPRFSQTNTVKRPQWVRPALGLFSECNPGAAAVAGERPQQRSFVGWGIVGADESETTATIQREIMPHAERWARQSGYIRYLSTLAVAPRLLSAISLGRVVIPYTAGCIIMLCLVL